jgi:hypothetical protein
MLLHQQVQNTTSYLFYSLILLCFSGMAAINIGGITLHQYAGIGLGEGTKVELAAKVAKGKAVQWWRSTKVLIIDEVSIFFFLFSSLTFHR